MIETIPTADGRVIGLSIDGKIDAADINRITDEISARLENHDRLRLYAEVKDWTGMSWDAFLKDVTFSLQHFHDFEKEAIVSDKKWLETLAMAGDRLFRGIEVKHFGWENQADAMNWVKQ